MIKIHCDAENKSCCCTFTDNNEIVTALEVLLKHAPQKWNERGRMKWELHPIDKAYGDPLGNGLLCVRWGFK